MGCTILHGYLTRELNSDGPLQIGFAAVVREPDNYFRSPSIATTT